MAIAARKGLDPEWLAERTGPECCEFDARVPEQLDVWPGHFPRYFIVPGVLQIDWVIRLAAAHFGAGAPSGIDNLKFKTPLLPRQPFTLRLERTRGGRAIDFTLEGSEGTFSSGRLQLEAAPS